MPHNTAAMPAGCHQHKLLPPSSTVRHCPGHPFPDTSVVPAMAVVIPAMIALVVVATVVVMGAVRIDDAAAHGRDGYRHGDEKQAAFHGLVLRSVRASHSSSPCPQDPGRVNRENVVIA